MRKRFLAALLLVAALGLGVLAGAQLPHSDDDFFALRKNFEIFGAVYEELATGYVDPVDPERLMRDGVDAMLEDLDPYTVFLDEADNADLSIITRGQYGGVGLSIARRAERITVTAPIEGTSGYKQGVRAGDVITRIGTTPADSLSLTDVRHLLRGEPGTTVEVAVRRAGEAAPLTFTLTRERVQLKNVTYRGFLGPADGRIGYVKLERFTRAAGEEMKAAVEALQQDGALGGLILDLRDNPGGLLGSAVDVTSLFVPRGSRVVSTRGRSLESERIYRSQQPPLAPDVPLVVLVNEYSASASEIVAGAIQDLDRGVILGTTTFGKGLVQVIRDLPYNTSLKMTTAKYYTPSGRSIQAASYGAHGDSSIAAAGRNAFQTREGRAVRGGRGIEPDVEVAPPPASPLEQALERRAAFFFYANHYAATNAPVAAAFEPTDATLAAFRDWIAAEEIAVETDAERAVDQLAGTLEDAAYADAADEVEALKTAVRAEKMDDFAEHAAALKERLRREILARDLDRPAQVEAQLAQDDQAQAAARLLRTTGDYEALLQSP